MKAKHCFHLILLLVLCVAKQAVAQDRQAITNALVENQKAFQTYSWKSTLVSKANEATESTDVYTVTRDASSKLSSNRVSTQERGFANRGQEKYSRDYRTRIHDLILSYLGALDPTKLQATLSSVPIEPFAGSTYRITLNNVQQKGDVLMLYVDRNSSLPVRADIQTKAGSDPVTIQAKFTTMLTQPNNVAPTRIVVNAPSEKRTLTIDNSDFVAKTQTPAQP